MANIIMRTPEPGLRVSNSDVEFEARRPDGTLIGTLKISRGSIEWVPVNHTYGYDICWEDFDDLMRENGQQRR